MIHDWSSGCLATASAMEKLFFCNNGASFEIVDEEYVEEFKDKSENENTKNRIKYWKNV